MGDSYRHSTRRAVAACLGAPRPPLMASAPAFACAARRAPGSRRARARPAPSARGSVGARVSGGTHPLLARPPRGRRARGAAAASSAAAGRRPAERELGRRPRVRRAARRQRGRRVRLRRRRGGGRDTAAVGRYLGATARGPRHDLAHHRPRPRPREAAALDRGVPEGHRGRVVPLQRAQVPHLLRWTRPARAVANAKKPPSRSAPRVDAPPLAFPIIWSTIALLRAEREPSPSSSTSAAARARRPRACSSRRAARAWNSAQHRRRRRASPSSASDASSSPCNVVLQYWKARRAGYLIAPSACGSRHRARVAASSASSSASDGTREPPFPTRRRGAAEA